MIGYCLLSSNVCALFGIFCRDIVSLAYFYTYKIPCVKGCNITFYHAPTKTK